LSEYSGTNEHLSACCSEDRIILNLNRFKLKNGLIMETLYMPHSIRPHFVKRFLIGHGDKICDY